MERVFNWEKAEYAGILNFVKVAKFVGRKIVGEA
jgi:hypothetical protein